jgi:hypothetical protein
MSDKPVYEIGIVLVVIIHNGVSKMPHFFKLTERLKSGNYKAIWLPIERRPLSEFTTCEGYKIEFKPKLEESFYNYKSNICNLRWYKNYNVFSFEQPLFLVRNEIYDPSKSYYHESS